MRGLAAQFKQHAGDVRGGGLGHLGADSGRAGERYLVDAGVGGQRLTDRGAEAGDHVEVPDGNPASSISAASSTAEAGE